MLLIKTGICPLVNITICGILIDENKSIMGEVVLAGYSGGSGLLKSYSQLLQKKLFNKKQLKVHGAMELP